MVLYFFRRMDRCTVFRFLPNEDSYVYLKNKDWEMIALLNSKVLQHDERHEAIGSADVPVDLDEDGEEDGDDEYDEEETSSIVSQPTTSRRRGPSIHTKAYKNLTTIVVPISTTGPKSGYTFRTMSKFIFVFFKYIRLFSLS